MNYQDKTKDDLIKELHKLQKEFDSLKKIKNLKQEEETLRILARFPTENPDPVLRVDRNGLLLFANEASYKFLTWKLQIGKKAPSVLQKIIAESLKEGIGKIIETEHNQRIFSFIIIPIVESGYANLYGRDLTELKQAEETMIQQNNALSMLSNFSVALSMMSSEDSLEKFIVKRIKEITGAEMATFSEYNPENRTLTIKQIEIKPWLLEKGVSLLGKQLDKIQFVVNDETYREIIANPIGKQRTLFEVSFGAISQPVGETIKSLLKADRFIAVAYIIEGKLYGTSVLAMSKDKPDPLKEILMNFIFLASASLRRKRAEVALLSTSRRLELALNSAKAGIWEWDIATDHMEWSPQMFDLLKLDSLKTVASIELWRATIHPEDIEQTRSQLEQALKQRTMLNTDSRVVLPDGQTCWLNILGEGVYDNQGRPISMIGISMNINGRKLDEEALHLEKENFRYSLDDSPLGVIIFSPKGKMVYANKTILNFYGYDSLRELQKTSIKKRHTPKSYAESQKRNRQKKLGICATNYEISIVRKNGEIRHLMVFRKEILWNDIWQLQAIYEDITQRKLVEEEIKNMKESMAKMHQHLDEIRENERALISREIHDQIGQSLTALKIDLSWLSGKIACDSEENAKLKRMIDLVDALSLDVHRISSELRPTILDDLGLASALEWYCEEFANRTGLKVKIEIEDVQTENMKKNLSIYRVAQELLTNIIRHAGAKKVRVILRKTNNDIIMSIQDDGIGISPDKVRSSKSLGFLGMFERVKQSAGNMEIKTPSEGGTSVRIRIPIK
jgi:PAS domain S-box-containing protein